jgi:hypothetical protein
MAVGLLTAALAIGAHAVAGGAVPLGAAAALLSLLAVTAGAVATNVDRTAETPVLFALLTVGQLVAHVMLTAAAHTDCAMSGGSPASGGTPAAVMLAAHTVALVVCATLIAAGDRLYRAVTSALRAFAGELPGMLATAPAAAVTAGDQPLRSTLLLAASVSRRGPPVSLAR